MQKIIKARDCCWAEHIRLAVLLYCFWNMYCELSANRLLITLPITLSCSTHFKMMFHDGIEPFWAIWNGNRNALCIFTFYIPKYTQSAYAILCWPIHHVDYGTLNNKQATPMIHLNPIMLGTFSNGVQFKFITTYLLTWYKE